MKNILIVLFACLLFCCAEHKSSNENLIKTIYNEVYTDFENQDINKTFKKIVKSIETGNKAEDSLLKKYFNNEDVLMLNEVLSKDTIAFKIILISKLRFYDNLRYAQMDLLYPQLILNKVTEDSVFLKAWVACDNDKKPTLVTTANSSAKSYVHNNQNIIVMSKIDFDTTKIFRVDFDLHGNEHNRLKSEIYKTEIIGVDEALFN